ncbi:MAG: zinc-ribbon domain-containing protein [Candidatus Atabeyarchaeum deiterrae]
MDRPRRDEVLHCQRCGATVEEARGLGGALLGDVELVTDPERSEPGEVDLTEQEAEDKWRRDHEDQRTEVNYCEFCGAKIKESNTKFCPNCGASLETD